MITRWKPIILSVVACLVLSAGCATTTPDSSPSAISSGDVSLVQTACSPVPTKGMDVCRERQGDPITSGWTVYLPWSEDALSAEVRVRHGDKTYTYKASDFSVEIPWTDVFGSTWNTDSAGLVQALATVKYKDKVVQALGYAFIVILKPGFDPIPSSSYGALAYKQCSITYTTAGRSVVRCQ